MLSNEERFDFIRQYSQIASSDLLMNNPDAIALEKFVESHRTHFDQIPRKLYKYRRFDRFGYTYDAIRNNRFFLSRANSFDDKFEASLEIMTDNDNPECDILLSHLIRYIAEIYNIDPYVLFDYVEKAKKDKECGGSLFLGYLIDYLRKMSLDENKIAIVINVFVDYMIGNLRSMIFERMGFISSLKTRVGVHSLTTNNTSQIMWQYYADNYRGCCIEYVIDDSDYSNLFDLVPVLYSDERRLNVIDLAIDCVLGEHLFGQDYLKDLMTISSFRAATIKNREWAFQDEWRIIGEPGYSVHKSPRINAIFLGNNIVKKNLRKMLEISKARNIPLYMVQFDYDKTAIRYEAL